MQGFPGGVGGREMVPLSGTEMLCQHLSAAERTSSARNSFPPTTSVALGVRGAAGSAWPHSALVPGSLHLSGTPEGKVILGWAHGGAETTVHKTLPTLGWVQAGDVDIPFCREGN